MMHNHSSFRFIFLPVVIKGRVSELLKKNFNIPLLGLLLNRFKAIPIQRSGAIKKSINSLKIAESRIQTGYHVAIFPEGTRTLNGKLSEFKRVASIYNLHPNKNFTYHC